MRHPWPSVLLLPLAVGGPTTTRWLREDISNLADIQTPLPQDVQGEQNLALTVKSFRGCAVDYYRALVGVIWHLHAKGALSWPRNRVFLPFVPLTWGGLGDMALGFTMPSGAVVEMVLLPDLAPCGIDSWAAEHPAVVTWGLEVSFEGHHVPPVDLEHLIPEVIPCFNPSACPGSPGDNQELTTHLHWSSLGTALPSGWALAERGQCARCMATLLPELAPLAHFVAGSAAVPWHGIRSSAITCIEKMEGIFWELELSEEDWPELLGESSTANRVFTGTAVSKLGRLLAFLCVPAWTFTAPTGLYPCPECVHDRIVSEALPLVLAHRAQAYSAIAALPPPAGTTRRIRGGRSGKLVKQQIAEFHTRTVRQALAKKMQGALRQQRATQWRTPTKQRLAVAVCISGLARSFSDYQVYRSIKQNGTFFGDADASIFYVLDFQGRSLADFDTAFRELPAAGMVFSGGMEWGNPERCNLPSPASAHHQFHKLRICLRMIEASEASRGGKFDWLVRFRPDISWQGPIGDLRDLDSDAVHLSLRQSGGDPTDYFALVPRTHAEAYFGMECPTEEQLEAGDCAGMYKQNGKLGFTNECALKVRLDRFGVRIRSFPDIFTIVRPSECHEGDLKCAKGWDKALAPGHV